MTRAERLRVRTEGLRKDLASARRSGDSAAVAAVLRRSYVLLGDVLDEVSRAGGHRSGGGS